MDRVLLRDAVRQLETSPRSVIGSSFASGQAVEQFDGLLDAAKKLYPERADIQSIKPLEPSVMAEVFTDSVLRLSSALNLRPVGSASELVSQIRLPSNAPEDIVADLCELEAASSLGLLKTSLLLTGSIAESLLLLRHPDTSLGGPGLRQLVTQARDQKLFGRDTLRHLEALVDYRDLIHPRSEKRNQTFRNEARVESALTALKLLCTDLDQEPTLRFRNPSV